MYLSLNWLKDFVNIPKSLSPEDLGKLLTLHTVEVEKIERQSGKYDKVIVGKILEIAKHPNADRLQIAQVDTGKEKLTIVCGAPNIAVGQMVPVALVGAVLPNGLEIKAAEVRGEKSFGMLCAEDELGLGNDHSGIMILKKAKLGENFSDYLGLDDIILEVDNKSLSNRPDLWGHFGLAREIAACLESDLKEKNLSKIKINNPAGEKLEVKIESKGLCPRYMALKLEGVEIKESPGWLKNRLISVGLKPINNIVDITNYVMLELGQPLHAFDAKNIKKILVRRASKGEILETLDGKSRELDDSALLITDGKKPLALAGLMGGQESAIKNDTKEIIIEAATFDAATIRKGSTKLALRTDASVRFEKALDPELCEQAMKLAVKMIQEDNKKVKITSQLSDIKNYSETGKTIELKLSWLEKIIGLKIEEKRIKNILRSLGFKIKEEGDDFMLLQVPSWRATKDISIKEDIAEEIIRIYGYNNLPALIPQVDMKPPIIDEERVLENKIKQVLAKECRLAEVYNYSFVGEDDLKKLNLDFSSYIKLANPISKQHTMLRQTLVPGLLSNLKTNQHKYEKIALFEIGNIFLNVPGSINKDNKNSGFLPYQERQISLLLAGYEDNFAKIKSILSNLIHGLALRDLKLSFLPTELIISYGDRLQKALINLEGKNIGTISKLDEAIAKNYGLKKAGAIAEISFKELHIALQSSGEKQYEDLPKYPPLIRDLAFVLDEKISYEDLYQAIKTSHPLIKEVELFDVYSGKNLGNDKKSLAFHIVYQSPERTLTAEEVDKAKEELINSLEEKFQAQIRDF